MIQKSKVTNGKNTDTIIGEGIVFEDALLKGSGIIRIDGKFSGVIDIDGHVILGETGLISGDVSATSALFAGKHQGDLRVSNTLHVTSTAILTGKIETGKLIIDEGATINGTCKVNKGDNNTASSDSKPATAKSAPPAPNP